MMILAMVRMVNNNNKASDRVTQLILFVYLMARIHFNHLLKDGFKSNLIINI